METATTTNVNRYLETAVSRLMKITRDGESARISMPILFPSGSSAAINVAFNDGKCFVSDLGLGQMEAELNGADSFYAASATKAATRFGVGFDGLSIFKTWATLDRIESAILAVSNASVSAASSAIFRAIEEKERQKNEELFDRVAQVFGIKQVSKALELSGREAIWDAHNVVLLSTGRKAIFEYVSENQNSIASKFMMFSDLSKVEEAYSLTSVVSSVERISKKGIMLADVSTILALKSTDERYRQTAIAA